jgi:hypothetical protein
MMPPGMMGQMLPPGMLMPPSFPQGGVGMMMPSYMQGMPPLGMMMPQNSFHHQSAGILGPATIKGKQSSGSGSALNASFESTGSDSADADIQAFYKAKQLLAGAMGTSGAAQIGPGGHPSR